MDSKHSRRMLIVGTPDCGALDLVQALTGSAPELDISGSCAGLTHEWDVETKYYSAKVHIWIDEVTDLEAWKTEFLKPEAKEVVEAVGAWIYCFRRPREGGLGMEIEETMKAIQEVVEEHASYGADVVSFTVGMPGGKDSAGLGQEEKEEADDVALQYGFEYIDYAAQGCNEFGEKQGFEGLKEALEANEWAATADDDEDEDGLNDLELDDNSNFGDFSREEAEMTAELFGVKASLIDENYYQPETEDFIPAIEQKAQVDDMERMVGKLLAVKEQSADLPEEQRKRMAAQAVRELMSAEGEG